LYAEYWDRYHLKMTLDAVQPSDEEPLIGRSPFVEGNHQRKVGRWYWLALLVYRSKNRRPFFSKVGTLRYPASCLVKIIWMGWAITPLLKRPRFRARRLVGAGDAAARSKPFSAPKSGLIAGRS
jgi:hypothetical protein